MELDTFKTENESSDIMTDPIPLNDESSVKLEIDETENENVPDLQNVMTVKAEIDDNEMGKFFWTIDPTQPNFKKMMLTIFRSKPIESICDLS